MSWNTLKEIYERNQKEAEEAKKPITQCPQCAYSILKTNKKGDKLCPICEWRNFE